MLIYFRTRGGPIHGWGNIVRLVNFAKYCKEQANHDIIFFIEGTEDISKYIADKGFTYIQLAEDISLDEEATILSSHKISDITICEMLESNYERQKILKQFTNQLVILDDLLDHYYCADKVICAQEWESYPNKIISDVDVNFLIGYKYFIFNPQFEKYHQIEKQQSESMSKISVIFGGGRYDIAFIKTAIALSQYQNVYNIKFILGHANYSRLINKIKKIIPKAEIIGGVDNIAEIMFSSDLVFVGGGYTKIEAAITKTPMIIMSVQWHQIPLSQYFQSITSAPYLGYMSMVEPEQIKSSLEEITNITRRNEIVDRSHNLFDMRGSKRIYDVITN